MRTSLPGKGQTAPVASLKPRKRSPETRPRLPSRSGRHLGAAECVDQTFPKIPKIQIDTLKIAALVF